MNTETLASRVRWYFSELFREPNDIERHSEDIIRLGKMLAEGERQVIEQFAREDKSTAAMKALGMCYYSPEHDGVFLPAEIWDELKPHIQSMVIQKNERK